MQYPYDFPEVKDLGLWLRRNRVNTSTNYARKFVVLDELCCRDVSALGDVKISVQFSVIHSDGSRLLRLPITDLLHTTGDQVNGPFRELIFNLCRAGSMDKIKIAHVSRRYIAKTLFYMMSYFGPKSDDSLFHGNDYLRPYKQKMRMLRNSMRGSDEILCGLNVANGMSIQCVQRHDDDDNHLSPEKIDELRDMIRESMRPACTCSKSRKVLSSITFGKVKCRCPPSRRLQELEDLERGDSVIKSLGGVPVQFSHLGKHELLEGVEKSATAEVRPEVHRSNGHATIGLADAPCFKVVNSSIRSIEGFIRLHIGDKPPKDEHVRVIPAVSLRELIPRLRAFSRIARENDVKGVLLSGDLWVAGSRYSSKSLNGLLPKCFDDLQVRVIAQARYADAVARDVRMHFVDPEGLQHTLKKQEAEFTNIHFPDTPAEIINSRLVTRSIKDEPSVGVLQQVYTTNFPNDSLVDVEMKLRRFNMEPFDVPMPEIRMHAPKDAFLDTRAMGAQPYMRPVLKTHLEMRHPVNQNELVYGVYKRNYNPATESTIIDSQVEARELFKVFMNMWKNDPAKVQVDDKDGAAYVAKRNSDYITALQRELHQMIMAPHKWFALTKPDPKPTVEDGQATAHSATQVIICRDKRTNVRFGPTISFITSEITRVLKENYFIFSEHDNYTFEDILTERRHLMRGRVLEVDISKYDKSQGFTSLFFELYLFQYMGMPEYMLREWLLEHLYGDVKSMVGPTRFSLCVQRKSGDAYTYYGNTFYLMAVLQQAASSYGKHSVHFMMASGDDSLVWGDFPDTVYARVPEILQSCYNLEAKVVRSKVKYFCSRIMIEHQERIYLVPDPVKALIKFGRKDVRDRGHIEDIRMSLLDHIDAYQFIELRQAVDMAVQERYGYGMFGDAMLHMYSFACNRQAYHTLFDDNPNASSTAILIPADVELKGIDARYITHAELVTKRFKRLDNVSRAEYMRAIAKDLHKKVLLTYLPEYVPQNTRIIADLRSNFTMVELKDTLKFAYRY